MTDKAKPSADAAIAYTVAATNVIFDLLQTAGLTSPVDLKKRLTAKIASSGLDDARKAGAQSMVDGNPNLPDASEKAAGN